MGKFIISRTAAGDRFILQTDRGYTLAVSRRYATLDACKKGIVSLIANAPTVPVRDLLSGERGPNPKFEILGIAITKADERKKYFKQTLETLKELEGVTLFETYIRVDSAIEWAQDSSRPVVDFKKASRSAKEYRKLTKEIIDNVNRKECN